jgi:hypothetical protein
VYGVADYLMMLQEVVKSRLDRQQVQEVDQEGTRQPPGEEWATKEEERDG